MTKEEDLKEGLAYFKKKFQSMPFMETRDIHLDKVPKEDLDKIAAAGTIIKKYKGLHELKKGKFVDFTGLTEIEQAALELGERTFMEYV